MIMAWRDREDDLALCSVMMVIVDEKERDRG